MKICWGDITEKEIMAIKIRETIGPYFHALVCIHHVSIMIYSQWKKDFSNVTDQRVLDMQRFAPIFFTSWNMIIQTIYFILALTHDVLCRIELKKDIQEKIKIYKGYIFTSLVFPSTIFVFTMFWSVYSLNREWVLPEVLDEYIPNWQNHSLHTNILIFLVIEVLIVNQLLPTFKSALIGLTALSTVYHLLFITSYFLSGRWAYGLFYIFSWPERALFMLSNYLFTVIVMKIGMWIQTFKHSLTRTKTTVSKSGLKEK